MAAVHFVHVQGLQNFTAFFQVELGVFFAGSKTQGET